MPILSLTKEAVFLQRADGGYYRASQLVIVVSHNAEEGGRECSASNGTHLLQLLHLRLRKCHERGDGENQVTGDCQSVSSARDNETLH